MYYINSKEVFIRTIILKSFLIFLLIFLLKVSSTNSTSHRIYTITGTIVFSRFLEGKVQRGDILGVQ